MKNKYHQNKERARFEAMQWQLDFENNNYSYGELSYYQSYFEIQAKRYGLIKEFKENGIL